MHSFIMDCGRIFVNCGGEKRQRRQQERRTEAGTQNRGRNAEQRRGSVMQAKERIGAGRQERTEKEAERKCRNETKQGVNKDE
ncbi:MAG: hypothetical protein NC254_05980 [bacterium]|nr:hypothetical protein [bacterium]